MDDKDLKALKDIDVPTPSGEARSAALQTAMMAFEEAGKKTSSEPQGSEEGARLTSTFIQSPWEWIMEKRMLMGTVAASLLAVPVATHLIWNDTSGDFAPITTTEVRQPEKTEDVKPVDDQTTAKPDERKEFADTDATDGAVQPAAPAPASEQVATDEVATLPPPTPKPQQRVDVVANEPEPLGETEADDTLSLIQKVPEAEFAATPPAKPSAKRKRQTTGILRGLRSQADPPKGVSRFMNTTTGGGTFSPDVVQPREENRDKHQATTDNPVKRVATEPVSTFSIDVDTASYPFVRRNLENGSLPNRNAVRVEEMINYFSYDYPAADTKADPFKPSVAVYPSPWNENTLLMHVGIKGHEIIKEEKPRSNLVFLIDVSGSMQSKDKLPLLKSAFRLLVDTLEPEDTVSIVTYAGNAGTVLEPTKVSDKRKILAALDKLRSGGSTAGAQGIRQAYALAEQEFDKEGINRVILATDGDFNVGISDTDQLKTYIETKRKSGVYLSILGFGQGNYNDHLMQVLAQNGNGNAAYIDSLREAQKVLVEEAGSTLFPIATDVKIQVEFNPAQIAEYRLIGYETRALNREDFNNDKVDAGDIGSGHTVTAIYELTPASAVNKFIDDLRYQTKESEAEPKPEDTSDEFAFLKMRYKLPGEQTSKLLTLPITPALLQADVDALSDDMRFAASVAAFGQKLRGNAHLVEFSYDEIIRIASGARGDDRFGYRSEFVSLVRLAKSIDPQNR